jgi:hypothetical protein
MKTLSLLLTIACLLPATAAAQCYHGKEALVANVHDVSTDGKMNYYHIAATVANVGAPQASNAMQFVDMYQHDEKLDAKGVQPLNPGRQQTVYFTWKRSVDAGPGTTVLTFKLDPACDTNHDLYNLTF